MEHQVTSIIGHIAESHVEMAKILEVNRDIVVHMVEMISAIPDNQSFDGLETVSKNSMLITGSITSYLNGIADLEEAIAENLSHVMKELIGTDEEE